MIRIYGHSDDCFEIECSETDKSDELSAYKNGRSVLVGTVKGGLVVRGRYAPKRSPTNGIGDGGTWQLSIDLVDEDVPIPWKVSVEVSERGYSPVIAIDCPDGTPWRELKSGNAGDGDEL